MKRYKFLLIVFLFFMISGKSWSQSGGSFFIFPVVNMLPGNSLPNPESSQFVSVSTEFTMIFIFENDPLESLQSIKLQKRMKTNPNILNVDSTPNLFIGGIAVKKLQAKYARFSSGVGG